MDSDYQSQLARDFPTIFSRLGTSEFIEISTPLGWRTMVRDLSAQLEELARLILDPPYVIQIKQKFGGLRYYMRRPTEEMNQLIKIAEDRSVETCEVCGGVGKMERLSERDYGTTLCQGCLSRAMEIKSKGGDALRLLWG